MDCHMRRPPGLMKSTAGSAPAPVPPDPGPATNYLDLYGLSKPPFGGPREGNGFILFGSQKRSFELLIGHIVNGSGVILLQGEEGVGKSEMLRTAGDVAAESGVPTIRLNRPVAGRTNLSQLIAALGGPGTSVETTGDEAIQRFLTPPRKALLVDDIDLLPEQCVRLLLTTLRRMSTDPGGPAIAISSTAQPDTDPQRPDLTELSSLVRATIRMSRLGPAEIQQYVERSLWMAGGTTRRLIAPDALKMIIARSGGVTASVDRLMEAAFTTGFARGDSMITAKTIATMSGGAPRRERIVQPNGVVSLALQITAVVLLVSGASVFLYGVFSDPGRQSKPAPLTRPAMPPKPVVAPPAQPPPSAKPAETMPPDLIAALLKRGDQSFALGDTAAARLFFRHAADGGSAAAATALGKTYDPYYAVQGEKPDKARAIEWYRKASALGDTHAADLLKALDAR
jgi:type II secretory pathway predicted ATPase ExeA